MKLHCWEMLRMLYVSRRRSVEGKMQIMDNNKYFS
jgi:hypothetical protein